MRRLIRAAAVVSAGGVALVMLGCTPDDPTGGSTPGPASPSSGASPTESAEDRAERERGEHAIEVYERADDELVRLLKSGEEVPSDEFRKYASGSYLDAASDLLMQLAEDGVHVEGELKRLDIRLRGQAAADRVLLLSCEDASSSRYVDKEGKEVGQGQFSVQKVEVELIDSQWMVTVVESKGLESLEETECSDAA